MYCLFLFSLLYLVKKYMVSNGKDERIIYHKDKIVFDNTTCEKMFKIYETIEKIQLLESNNVSLCDKLYEINNRNVPETFNIFVGGLFNDWDIDFPV